jgi:hypothetical protein
LETRLTPEARLLSLADMAVKHNVPLKANSGVRLEEHSSGHCGNTTLAAQQECYVESDARSQVPKPLAQPQTGEAAQMRSHIQICSTMWR